MSSREGPTEEREEPTEELDNPTEESDDPTEESVDPTEESDDPTEESDDPTEESHDSTEDIDGATEEKRKTTFIGGESEFEQEEVSEVESDYLDDEQDPKKLRKALKDTYGDIGPIWTRPNVTIVYRNEWGARPPVLRNDLRFPVRNVIFTSTRTEECHDKEACMKIVRLLQAQHISEGYSDIKYNFLAGSDKVVYEGRGWKTYPDKNEKYPELFEKCIEIAYIGNFDDHEPPVWMMEPPWFMLETALMSDMVVTKFRVHEDLYQPKSISEELEKKFLNNPPS